MGFRNPLGGKIKECDRGQGELMGCLGFGWKGTKESQGVSKAD